MGPPLGAAPVPTFELAEQRVLTRCVPQVTGEHELASCATGATADRSDADHRSTGQAHQKVEPRVHPGWTSWECSGPGRIVLRASCRWFPLPGSLERSAPTPVVLMLTSVGRSLLAAGSR